MNKMKWREVALDPKFNLECYLDSQDKKIEELKKENERLKEQINERKKLDRMRFNMVMSHYGIVKESEEMKTIEWLNKKRFDTSLTGIELNYLNILYYLILNVLEVTNEKS